MHLVSNVKLRKFVEKSKQLLKKSLYNLTDSDNPLNHQRSMHKESWGNTTVCRFLESIWFHTLKKDGVNIPSLWSSKKLLLKQWFIHLIETQTSLTLLLESCRRYFCTIFVYTVARLHSLNIWRSIKRKMVLH